jgi:hypothetical protein
VSSKKTRTTSPVSATPQESQPDPTSRTAKAKLAPALGASASPEPPAAKSAGKPASKAKAKPATASAAKPKPATAPSRAPRAASTRTSQAEVPPDLGQPIATAPAIAAAIVEAPASEVVRVVTDEDIRIRAYFLSIEHRARGGSDIDFWLIAERELRHGIKAKS